jgi:hypothetical protein
MNPDQEAAAQQLALQQAAQRHAAALAGASLSVSYQGPSVSASSQIPVPSDPAVGGIPDPSGLHMPNLSQYQNPNQLPTAGVELALSDQEFATLWQMVLMSERVVGRPKDWDGSDKGFDPFVSKFADWLSNMPGGVDRLLKQAEVLESRVQGEMFTARESVMSKAIMQALKSMVEGKALSIIRQLPAADQENGFEACRQLYRE